MVTVITGLLGGLVATIVMTIAMVTLGDDSPPPTAMFWTKYVSNGDPTDAIAPGMILHLIYGTIAGGVLAAVVPMLGFVSVGTLTDGVLWGLVYGGVLFVGAAVFWMKIVLDIDAELPQVVMFLVFHLIYGLVLGAWLGAGVLA